MDELCFSTTDGAGIIKRANPVFVRVSHFSQEELVGAPHSIVRHPNMPGGAFRVVWDMCLAGVPTCAYVQNLAADGSSYHVFATIAPLRDGFLSVQMKPCRPDLQQTAYSLYRTARGHECAGRVAGGNKHKDARVGLGKLTELLAAAGYPSYVDFVLAALPAEVQAREKRSAGLPARPRATGPLASMLNGVRGIHDSLDELMHRLDRLGAVADQLGVAAARSQQTMRDLHSTASAAEEATGHLGGSVPTMVSTSRAITTAVAESSTALDNLVANMGELQANTSELRFRIALARLHTTMMGTFVAELIDRSPGYEGAVHAIGDLCWVLEDGLDGTVLGLEENSARAADALAEINSASQSVTTAQQLLANWRMLVTRNRVLAQVADFIPKVDAQVRKGHQDMVSLQRVAGSISMSTKPYDSGQLEQHLRQVRHALKQLETQPVT
ncbi:MAG: histidine kinase [Micrococcales bacterium]|nr:MAG: histidine kinase [Micrococcales bacterium]PIE27143.1 MAG: histidine kinase [Micrococcales bacterium]